MPSENPFGETPGGIDEIYDLYPDYNPDALEDLYGGDTGGDFGGLTGLGDYGGGLGDYDYGNIDLSGSGSSNANKDPAMYFDQITTTTVPPDMFDYLFNFDKPSRNRISGSPPVRKKFDAQALKAAYAAMLEKSQDQERSDRVTRSIFEDVEAMARQFLQRFTGPAPKVLGLLDRRAPILFRQNTFVKISLSQFSIVSTGTTGKNQTFLMPF